METPIRPEALYQGLSFIEGTEEMEKILVQGAQNLWECFIQVRGREEKYAGRLVQAASGGFEVALRSGNDLSAVRALMDATRRDKGEAPECLILLFSRKQFLNGVQARFEAAVPGTLQVKFGSPQKMFKMQRRNSLRLGLTKGYDIRVEFTLEIPSEQALDRPMLRKFRLQMLDVSKNGFAVHVPDEKDFFAFKKGYPARQVDFTLQGHRISGRASVMSVGRMAAGSGWSGFRVGFKLENLSEADDEWLETHVLAQSAYAII